MAAKFEILSGKSLAKAIAGRGKAVATFTAREHQLAYSALYHVEQHNCPSHLNALMAVTPTNYRAGLVAWAKAFGKVKFDADTRAFTFAKDKKSDMDAAMETAPADYQREAKKGAKPAFDEVKYIQNAIKRLTEEGANPRTIAAMEGVLKVAAGPVLAVAA